MLNFIDVGKLKRRGGRRGGAIESIDKSGDICGMYGGF